jgi:hypothetical protein
MARLISQLKSGQFWKRLSPRLLGFQMRSFLRITVAEHLWFFIVQEDVDVYPVVHAEGPGVRATDPGGDGLVIHRTPAGALLFRLWEVKKCTGTAAVSSTVNTAYLQLKNRALRYLAEYTAIAAVEGDDELSAFLREMIELWVDAAPSAAAGVSVATSIPQVPQRCFTSFGDHFPSMISPKRLRGMLTAVRSFPDFAKAVKEEVWKGL